MACRELQGAFSSLMTTQKDQSQETTSMVNGTATLDLATLTPVKINKSTNILLMCHIFMQKTPYPLTATLFSTFNFDQGRTPSIRRNIIHEYDTQQLETQDSTESETELMIPNG